MLSNYIYLSDGIKFIQQYLIELSLTDTIPEIKNCVNILKILIRKEMLMQGKNL